MSLRCLLNCYYKQDSIDTRKTLSSYIYKNVSGNVMVSRFQRHSRN